MLRKNIIASGIALAISAIANADYQAEISGSYLTGDIEAGAADADQDILVLEGSYYFELVNTDKGPLAEASFMDRASDVSVNINDGEIDGNGADIDVEGYGISTRLVSKDTAWLLELGYQNEEIDNFDSDIWSVGVGKYIAENTTLTFSYANSDSDGGDSDAYGIDLEHLYLLANDQVLRLQGGYAMADPDNGDDVDVWDLGATFYFNKNLGVSASYSLADSDDTELTTWILGGEWFINEQFSASLSYTETEDDETEVDSDAFVIGGRFRF